MTSLVDELEAVLRARGLAVFDLPSETATAEQAAASVGTSTKQIVKSLLLIIDPAPRPGDRASQASKLPAYGRDRWGRAVLLMSAGDRRVDLDLMASNLGVPRVRMATAAEVKSITGFPIGGVPPLGHANPVVRFMDERVLEEPFVYAAAGTRFRVFAVPSTELRNITEAKTVRVTGDG